MAALEKTVVNQHHQAMERIDSLGLKIENLMDSMALYSNPMFDQSGPVPEDDENLHLSDRSPSVDEVIEEDVEEEGSVYAASPGEDDTYTLSPSPGPGPLNSFDGFSESPTPPPANRLRLLDDRFEGPIYILPPEEEIAHTLGLSWNEQHVPYDSIYEYGSDLNEEHQRRNMEY